MSTTTLTPLELSIALTRLTNLEVRALESAYQSSDGNGHDFGYTDDIVVPGLKKGANGALVTSLLKKGIIVRDDEFGQFCFLSWGFMAADGDQIKYKAAEVIAKFLNRNKPSQLEEAPAPTEQPLTTTSMKLPQITPAQRSYIKRLDTAIAEASDGGAITLANTVPSFEFFDKVKVDKALTEELVKLKVIVARPVKEGRKEFFNIHFTATGRAVAEEILNTDLMGDAPLVVDGTKTVTATAGELAKSHRKSDGKAPPKTGAKIAGDLITGLTKDLKAAFKEAKIPAEKAPKAAPIDRAATRYEAIRHVMAAAKDNWSKKDYKPMITHLEATWPGLYKPKWTAEQRKTYSVGILDFCLAACRKLDTGKPANF